MEEAVELYKWICDLAGEKGLMLACENTLSSEQTRTLFAKIGRPNFTLCFDTQNYFLDKGYNTQEMLDQLMDLVGFIHVKHGKGRDLSGALLGKGDADFYGSIEVIKKHGFTGWVILENYYDQKPLSAENANPLELIKEDVHILKAALQ